jgi:phosphopentomutase
MACEVLSLLDRMLAGILQLLDENTLVLITSDHGNIEDLTTKGHTTHNVPLILCGAAHQRMADLIEHHGGTDLSSVTPSIVDFLSDAS